MLSFIIKDYDGNSIQAPKALTVVINADCNVPADDLSVTFPISTEFFNNANFIEAFKGDKLVFKGQIDEISDICNSKSAVTKITARSLAAFLLDNEAEPVTYINPAAGLIFNKHLKPFGINEYLGGEQPLFANLKINKGMTHWQVFENYCFNKYGKNPRITADGKALFQGYTPDEVITLSDKNGDINYSKIKRVFKRYKLISDVRLKLSENGMYNGSIKNTSDECRGINRVRFVNTLADTSSIGTADKIIAQSNINSMRYHVRCVGCYVDVLGKGAIIKDKRFGIIDNLIVDEIKYVLKNRSELTIIELRKKG